MIIKIVSTIFTGFFSHPANFKTTYKKNPKTIMAKIFIDNTLKFSPRVKSFSSILEKESDRESPTPDKISFACDI